MASIARFVSYDGGIAFSDSVIKIQKRDEDSARFIPISDVASIDMREPAFGDEGYIHIRVRGEAAAENNTLYFDEDQRDEAAQFKDAFDSFIGRENRGGGGRRLPNQCPGRQTGIRYQQKTA